MASGGGLLGTGGEAIAGAAHRLDEPVAVEALERLAEAPDVHVDGPLLDVHVTAPDAIQQLPAAVDPLRVRHEEAEQPILGGPERHGRLADHDPVAGGVE